MQTAHIPDHLLVSRVADRHGSAEAFRIEISAFTFLHGIPVEVGPSKPYWGDGTGDALQWVGFLSILAISAAIVVAGRRATNRHEQRATRSDTTSVTKAERVRPLAAAVLAPGCQ